MAARQSIKIGARVARLDWAPLPQTVLGKLAYRPAGEGTLGACYERLCAVQRRSQ